MICEVMMPGAGADQAVKRSPGVSSVSACLVSRWMSASHGMSML